MKKYFLFFTSVITLLNTDDINAQTIIENFTRFDIKNSSCEIFNSINVELEQKNSSLDAFVELKKNQKNNFPLNSQENINDFMNNFNTTLSNTKKHFESQEILWQTGKEIGKYGLSVLGNYSQVLPTKHLTNFLMPAIQQGYELYVDNEIKNGIIEHRNELDKVIVDRINLLYSNGIDVTNTNDEKAFSNLFALAHGDIPALNTSEYPIFNKELTKRAYDFIASNRKEIKLLDLRTTQQYEETLKVVDSKIDGYQKKITKNVENKLKEIGDSIGALEANQQSIFKILDNIKESVKSNETLILSLEQKMLQSKDNFTELKLMQEQHSKLIAKNAHQIDILNGYVFQSLNTEQKISGLMKGDFDGIYDSNEKKKLLGVLNELKTKETIISVANDIENYSKAIYGGLVNTGILKGKDAQNVGIFINSVSVLTGASRVFVGDYTGFTSVISGLGGVFHSPSKETPEMQMLKQMKEYMNVRFDRIEQRLDGIETKIDTLSSLTLNMYKTMALSFQATGKQLEQIVWKLENLNNKATALLFNDYQACLTLKKIFKARNIKFDSYSDFETFYTQECRQCLQGLTDFTIGKNNSYFFVSSNEQLKYESVIKNEINEVYEPIKNLFKIFYEQNLNTASYALMFPFEITNNSNKPLFYVSKLKNLIPLDIKDVLENYYSYEMINEFTELLMDFGNYFLIKGNSENFQPLTLTSYLNNNTINGVNQDLLETRFTKLLNIVQYSIAQQSLIAGNLMIEPVYSVLFSYSSDENAKDLSLKILNNNKLFAQNFSTYLINKNMDFADREKIRRLYTSAHFEKKSLDSLNSLIKLNDIKFIVDNESKQLQLTFERKGQNVALNCPSFEKLVENKMVNSDAIYSLFESRQKINSKLIDLTFTKNLPKKGFVEEIFKYHYTTNMNK